MQISAESSLPPGFGFFFDKPGRVISGEQPDASSYPPDRFAFNYYQAYPILATSQSDLTISAGYMAFNAFFDLFGKGASILREVLQLVLSGKRADLTPPLIVVEYHVQ